MSKLYFRYGAMNCGKTTMLLQVANNYEERGMNVLIIKPSIDTKANDKISSRIGIERKVDYLVSPTDNLKKYLILVLFSIILSGCSFQKNQQKNQRIISQSKISL